MDIDSMLSVERRLGIKEGDIDDFLSKANAVEEAIRGMRDGTIDPANVKIEGIDTDEEKAEKEAQRQKRLAELKQKQEELEKERSREERKRWWDGVDVMFPINKVPGANDVCTTEDEEKEKAESFHKMRYNANYSRWDQWTPSDPATKLEEEERARIEEQKRNEEFENNNKEFCDKYLNDLQEREKERSKKSQSADASRLKGNNYFKRKLYPDALKCYMEALKNQPYDVKILVNIAQVHIKLENDENSMEFLERVLRLDAMHTKALSRKAHVLASQNKLSEALICAKKALENESNNVDLQHQVADLELTIQNREDEQAIHALKAKAGSCSAEQDKAALLHKVLNASKSDDPLVTMKVLEEAIELPLVAAGFEILDKFVSGEEIIEKKGGAQENVVEKCLQLLKTDKQMRTYFRTSGGLKRVVLKLREFNDTQSAEDRGSLCVYLRLLTAATAGEPGNMLAITLENSDIVSFLMSVASLDFAISLEVMTFLNIYFEETLASTNAALLGSKTVLNKTIESLRSVIVSSTLHNNLALRLSCLNEHITFIKNFVFHDQIKSGKYPFPLSQAGCSSLIENLALSLQLLVFDHKDDGAIITNLEALLGCSQYGQLRSCFGDGIRAVNIKADIPCPSALHVVALLSVDKYSRPPFLPICLGLLMNICLASDDNSADDIRDKVIQSGCLSLVLEIVTADGYKRQNMDTLVLSRGAGLLARLAACSLALDTLKDPVVYAKLCRRLAENLAISERSEKWVSDECGYLVRTIASLTTLPQTCIHAALVEGLVESLLRIFPEPRTELGEITPASVVLSPQSAVPALLIGNAARCLMPLADDPENAIRLFKIEKNKGVQKLICALANCSDMRVRKNIAILLAKGARIPEVRTKIDFFRGMQMLVELQNQL